MLEHVLNIFERIIDLLVKGNIDNMQIGFMGCKRTTDTIFIVRQWQEKYIAKKKGLWMSFVDRVPREVVWWALWSLGVNEWLVSVVQ